MLIRVHNTLTRTKELFTPVAPPKVGMYVCGPTVYKPSHIGHMVGPVIFDTVKRFLVYCGYEVTWVVNITDVDDKLIVRARELNTTVKELAERMTADYVDCLHRLNVTGIDLMPRATESIAEMLDVIDTLIGKGYAYPAAGDVYFDVSKDADYGKLCNRDPEQMEAGARIEVTDRKRNPGDFALWKGAKPGEPAWDSPWGSGRPGWHIECTAMAIKYLGRTLDIHGGGLDLQFPHHENELAQSESYTDQPFARYWMHNGLMKMGAAKMAGSVGNVVNVVDLLKRIPADTLRFFLLNTHYRSPIDFGEEAIAAVERGLESFYRYFDRYERVTGESFYAIQAPMTAGAHEAQFGADLEALGEDAREEFLKLMADDFNTGGAIGPLFNLIKELNRLIDDQKLEAGRGSDQATALAELKRGTLVLKELTQILGVFLNPPPKAELSGDASLVAGLMEIILAVRADVRTEAKATKNKALFAVSDRIRDGLAGLNIVVEDRPDGSSWSLKK